MTGQPRLGIGVVGGGRVGTVLANALRALGHAVVGVTAVSEASRERAELLLPGVDVLTPHEVIRRAEVVLVTVPDDAIAEVVAGAATLGLWQVGQIVVHTSGVHGLEVLEPARAAGALPLAIHPAMTFTGTSIDLSRLSGVGKSTLVNLLVPGADRRTGDVNEVTGRGRHTSSSAVALPLPGGGLVIDTPGIRSFGLAHVQPEDLLRGFADLADAAAECPRGCTHQEGSPDCELDAWVRAATGPDGEPLSARDHDYRRARLASYRRLLAAR